MNCKGNMVFFTSSHDVFALLISYHGTESSNVFASNCAAMKVAQARLQYYGLFLFPLSFMQSRQGKSKESVSHFARFGFRVQARAGASRL